MGTPTEKTSEFLDHHLKTHLRPGMSYISKRFFVKIKNLEQSSRNFEGNVRLF